jgi:hypothetical protein
MKAGSGFPNTAFSSASYANHDYGVNVFARKMGVYGAAETFGSYRLPQQVDPSAGSIGVCGTARSYGVVGEIWHADDDRTDGNSGNAAVYGVCDRLNETGVFGENKGGGSGVTGKGFGGRSGDFSSTHVAQLHLRPTISALPSTGKPGDLFAKHTGTADQPSAELWFCTAIQRGQPVWKKVQFA